MTVIVSVVVGYITLKNSDEVLQNNLKHEIEIDSRRIKNHITQEKEKLVKVSQSLLESQEVISSLNLISNYEDKNNYNTLIFDTQKEILLEYSERFFEQDGFFEIKFYDKKSALIAKKSFHPNLGLSEYVTYNEGVCYLKSDAQLTKIKRNSAISQECVGRTKAKYENGYYKICDMSIVEFGGEVVGFTKVVYYFGEEELNSLAKNLIYPVSLITRAPEQKDFDTTILDEKLGVYVKHKINLSYIKQKRQELITKITLAVILMSIFMFFIFFMFINREVLKPLEKLHIALESILQRKYKPIDIVNNDEIGEIFESSNKIFEIFWQNYSSLQSYQESVDTLSLVTKTDLKGDITYANDLFCTTSEYTKEEIIGKSHSTVRHPDTPKKLFKQIWGTIKRGNTWRGTIKNRTKNGGFYWTDAVICPTYNSNEQIDGYMSIRRDITELMQSKEELEFRANYDLLTKLGSREKLHQDLKNTHKPCLALINIERFSQINDFYGHKFGDALLQEFSRVLQAELDERCTAAFSLYRYGADEFAVLIAKYEREKVLQEISTLLSILEKTSIVLKEKALNLNLSCGVSFEDAQQALLSADMARKISKKEQKLLVVYSEENSLNKQYENNLLWAGKIKSAIEENRIVPFFQPIVNNSNLAYEKYESLVRIVEPDGKVISPFLFLDIAKQTKQYLKITQIMVEKSFEVFKDKEELGFSINLTIEDISNAKMREFLFEKLDENPDIAKRVVLEIVESESIEDYGAVIEFISRVKSRGCKIAIDDFGSGYSNFEYLIKLQTDYIKIDGSLIKNINTQRESFVVVSTIVSFAKQMGIKTIAEFVEDEAILKTVQELGVDYSQGYYFSQPKKESSIFSL